VNDVGIIARMLVVRKSILLYVPDVYRIFLVQAKYVNMREFNFSLFLVYLI